MMGKYVFVIAAILLLVGPTWAITVEINSGNYGNNFQMDPAYVNNGDDVTVNNGSFLSSSIGIHNVSGNLVINNASLSADTPLFNLGNAVINNGMLYGAHGADNGGTLLINGGSLVGASTSLSNYNGVVTINGGYFQGMIGNGGSMTIRGGHFSSEGEWKGIWNQGTMTIYGVFEHYGLLQQVGYDAEPSLLIGTLADGEQLNIEYHNIGTIYLLPVPEPTSLLALLCGVGGMGGLVWKRRSA